jgi:hypothetical protein
MDISCAWDGIRDNIKTSAKEMLGTSESLINYGLMSA